MNATQEVFDDRTGRFIAVCDNCAARIDWGEESSRFDSNHPTPLHAIHKWMRGQLVRKVCRFSSHPLPKVQLDNKSRNVL